MSIPLCGAVLMSMLFSTLAAQKINSQLIQASFTDSVEKANVRKALAPAGRTGSLNPLNWVASGLLYVYQNVVSEQLQAECAYSQSCSQETKFAIHRHGFFRGTLAGLSRLSDCHTLAWREHPRVCLSYGKKISCVNEKNRR